MFERIFGKRKSIQRALVISFIISIAMVIIMSIIEFALFLVPAINTKLIAVNIESPEDISYFLNIIRKGLIITIINIIVISAMLIRINTKKMLQPIKQINEATKQVTLRKLRH